MPTPDVALIAPYPTGGGERDSGVASYTACLAHALAGEGVCVEVIAPREADEPARTQDGGVVVTRAFARGARAVPAAVRAAKATGAGTVHLQHEVFLYGGPASVPGLVGGLAALRAAPAAGVVTMHHVVDPAGIDGDFTALHRVGVPVPLARAALGGVQSAVRRLADSTVVHEPAFARAVPGATVVPHGVRVAVPADGAAARERLGLPADGLVALCFGFVAPYKGLEVALEAAELAGDGLYLVVAGGDHPRLTAAGDRYADDLRSRHGGHARFTGFVPEDEVAAWFAAADVALFPYPQPFSASGALALALAHRTPALLSPELAATAGAPEAMTAPREPRALAALLDELATERATGENYDHDAGAGAGAGVAVVRDGSEGAGVRLAATRPFAGGEGRLAAVRAATAELGRERAWPAVARRHLEVYARAGGR